MPAFFNSSIQSCVSLMQFTFTEKRANSRIKGILQKQKNITSENHTLLFNEIRKTLYETNFVQYI